MAVGASAPAPTATHTSAPSKPVAEVEPIVRTSIVTAEGASSGSVTGGTTVTVTGKDLAEVATVTFGGNAGTVVSATEDTVTITTPASTEFATGAVPVGLFASSGAPIDVAASASIDDAAAADPAAAPAGADAPVPVDPAADPAAEAPAAADPAAASAPLTFVYVPDPKIAAQLDYVQAHWEDYNTDEYGSISGNDCVNFTSQSLVARGWAMDAEWSYSEGAGYSTAWGSSTAFAAYLEAHPERATALTDAERAQVKVGDVVQFDWDSSGDQDHTGIVSRVEHTDAGVQVFYAGHTVDSIDKSVDESLANAGGAVSYWSVT